MSGKSEISSLSWWKLFESKCDQVKHVAAHLLFDSFSSSFPSSDHHPSHLELLGLIINTILSMSHHLRNTKEKRNKALFFFWAIYSFISFLSISSSESEKKSDKVYCSTFPKTAQISIDMIYFSLSSSCAAVHVPRPFVSLFTYFQIPRIRREESYGSGSGKPVWNGQ